jgi:hypothetical protein
MSRNDDIIRSRSNAFYESLDDKPISEYARDAFIRKTRDLLETAVIHHTGDGRVIITVQTPEYVALCDAADDLKELDDEF